MAVSIETLVALIEAWRADDLPSGVLSDALQEYGYNLDSLYAHKSIKNHLDHCRHRIVDRTGCFGIGSILHELQTLIRSKKMIHIGFTGTRWGMAVPQHASFKAVIAEYIPFIWHHGDCIGADNESGNIIGTEVWCLNCRIICHPPVDQVHRAFNKYSHETREPKTHFARNRDIVNETSILIATPCDSTDQKHGGTWYTINYARKTGKPVFIIWPNGKIEQRK